MFISISRVGKPALLLLLLDAPVSAPEPVIPAEAGIQFYAVLTGLPLDIARDWAPLPRNDGFEAERIIWLLHFGLEVSLSGINFSVFRSTSVDDSDADDTIAKGPPTSCTVFRAFLMGAGQALLIFRFCEYFP